MLRKSRTLRFLFQSARTTSARLVVKRRPKIRDQATGRKLFHRARSARKAYAPPVQNRAAAGSRYSSMNRGNDRSFAILRTPMIKAIPLSLSSTETYNVPSARNVYLSKWTKRVLDAVGGRVKQRAHSVIEFYIKSSNCNDNYYLLLDIYILAVITHLSHLLLQRSRYSCQ